jgi:DNA-binding response OmpR family regulator
MPEKSRILVVDDDRELRENVAEVLGDFGFVTSVAENGEEALVRLDADDFDLVLLDLIMPGMGGMETLLSIRRKHPKVKVLMLTAFATVDNAVEAMRKGAEDYLAKPFRVDELLVTVRRILEEARFQDCRTLPDIEGTFNCLANALRREIVRLIHRERRIRFMDIARRLEVADHTKINFHLKMLKEAGLLRQDDKKFYSLTPDGEKVIACLTSLAKTLSP